MTSEPQIDACLRGDRHAQRELFGALAPRAFRVASRYVAQRASAEDIVQEAMARVFGRLGDFDPTRGALEGWAHRIFVNESLRYLRRHGRLQLDGREPTDRDASAAEPLALQTLAAAELRAMILALPEGYRVVFNLYEVEGYAHAEIAAELNITAGASRSQLARAKSLLRERVRAADGLPHPKTLAL